MLFQHLRMGEPQVRQGLNEHAIRLRVGPCLPLLPPCLNLRFQPEELLHG